MEGKDGHFLKNSSTLLCTSIFAAHAVAKKLKTNCNKRIVFFLTNIKAQSISLLNFHNEFLLQNLYSCQLQMCKILNNKVLPQIYAQPPFLGAQFGILFVLQRPVMDPFDLIFFPQNGWETGHGHSARYVPSWLARTLRFTTNRR